jgi:glycosyltransferase involved in cell wall biosynthesis
MIVAVNINVFPGGLPGMDRGFLLAAFSMIVRQYPQHQFVFISSAGNEWGLTGENIQWVKSGPQNTSLLLWRFWHTIKLPSLLKQHRASVLFSADYFFVNTLVPQLITGHNPDSLRYYSLFRDKFIGYYKKHIPLALKKASSIIAISDEIKNKIATHYAVDIKKITTVVSVAASAAPLNTEQQQAIKNEWTAGREYFINTNTICKQASLLTLLKAFSVLKKRQQTNMKLVLAGKPGDAFENIKRSLASYKYRDDVLLTGTIPAKKRNELIAASYVWVDTFLPEGNDAAMFTAFEAGVPVITTYVPGDAPALLIDPDNINDKADRMMLLYKDENFRNKLIIQGKEYAALHCLEKSAAAIWQCIEQVAVK